MKAIYIPVGVFLMWSVVLVLSPAQPIFIGWLLMLALFILSHLIGLGAYVMFNSPPEWDADKPYMPPGRYVRAAFTGDSNGNIELSSKADSGFILKRGKVIKPSRWQRLKAWLRRQPPPKPVIEPPTIGFKSPPPVGEPTYALYMTDFRTIASAGDTQKMLTVYSFKVNGTLYYTDSPWTLTDELCRQQIEDMTPRQRLIVEISCELMSEADYEEKRHATY